MGEKSLPRFLFTNVPSLALREVALILQVPAHLVNKHSLLMWYSDHLKFPDYFGWTWDALLDCLRDLSWIEVDEIAIVHRDIPLSGADQLAYLSILGDAAGSGARWLTVVFPEDCRSELRNLWEQS